MQAGTRLEHYEIIDKIGEGGMGAVYRAEDTRLRRKVAVKVLPPELSADAERLARLEREAQLLASLNHPNVAAVHGFGGAEIEESGRRRHVAFLVMELVEGQSLYNRVAAGPLPWREATEIAAGIAAGLETELGSCHARAWAVPAQVRRASRPPSARRAWVSMAQPISEPASPAARCGASGGARPSSQAISRSCAT